MVLLFLVSKLPELKCVEYVACGYAYVDVPHLGTIIGFEFNSHLVALYLSSETIVVNQSVIHFVHFYRQHAFLVHFRFGEPKSRIVPAYKVTFFVCKDKQCYSENNASTYFFCKKSHFSSENHALNSARNKRFPTRKCHLDVIDRYWYVYHNISFSPAEFYHGKPNLRYKSAIAKRTEEKKID